LVIAPLNCSAFPFFTLLFLIFPYFCNAFCFPFFSLWFFVFLFPQIVRKNRPMILLTFSALGPLLGLFPTQFFYLAGFHFSFNRYISTPPLGPLSEFLFLCTYKVLPNVVPGPPSCFCFVDSHVAFTHSLQNESQNLDSIQFWLSLLFPGQHVFPSLHSLLTALRSLANTQTNFYDSHVFFFFHFFSPHNPFFL